MSSGHCFIAITRNNLLAIRQLAGGVRVNYMIVMVIIGFIFCVQSRPGIDKNLVFYDILYGIGSLTSFLPLKMRLSIVISLQQIWE